MIIEEMDMSHDPDELEQLRGRIGELEEELAENTRLAVLGATMTGLAHSIRGAQGLCLAATHMVERALISGDQAAVERGWDMVKRSLSRIAGLCDGLLNPEQAGRLKLEPGDPDAIVAEVAEVASEQASDQGDRLELDLCGDLAGVVFDRLSVHRCCIELVCNSLDALAETPVAGKVSLHTKRDPAGWSLSVEDTGTGMTPEQLRRVLKGGYTTKGRGGSGLGLIQVRELVKQHGGRVNVSSEAGTGTKITCWFPNEPTANARRREGRENERLS